MSQFLVVSYDISNDKRWLKVSKTLLRFGDRVQYNVFECNLEQNEYEKMYNRLEKIISLSEDTIRIYRICERCKHEITIIGYGQVSEDPDLVVV